MVRPNRTKATDLKSSTMKNHADKIYSRIILGCSDPRNSVLEKYTDTRTFSFGLCNFLEIRKIHRPIRTSLKWLSGQTCWIRGSNS